ncbi:FHA domain-containing protein, partial [Nocardioides kribbensis]|uniref:FHA domain-containing protein n=1 Tax=Nocardioides kribbensis TaxID=305517 RepID=UPI0032DB1B9F
PEPAAEPVEPAYEDLPTERFDSLPPAPPGPPAWAPTSPPPSAPPAAPEPDPTPDPQPDPQPDPPPADHDHDGMTRAGSWDPDEFARPQAGIPGQPQAPSVTSRPVARLVVSSGDTVDVDRVVLVGRAPEARRFTSTEQPRLVTVPSPQQEISSTHLEVRPGSGADHGSAVVTDMGSTNGTVLVQPGLPSESLQPGIPVQLIPGALIDLGDGVTIQVTRP